MTRLRPPGSSVNNAIPIGSTATKSGMNASVGDVLKNSQRYFYALRLAASDARPTTYVCTSERAFSGSM